MKITHLVCLCISIVLFLSSNVAQAQSNSNRITFKGQVLDGPFNGESIEGFCRLRPNGDYYSQKTRCVVTLGSGLRVSDTNASIDITASQRSLRIIIGATIPSFDNKGNFKISTFQATTYYEREITLFDLPRDFLGVEASIGGVSINGGPTTTDPDCLIWDIVGAS